MSIPHPSSAGKAGSGPAAGNGQQPHDTNGTAGSNGVCPGTVHEAAYWYFDRGELPTPLKPRSKVPIFDAWQSLKTERADLDRLFPRGTKRNIGLRLGEPSRGLLDGDLDCPEAIVTGRHLLPRTGRIGGRRSAPLSHYFYVSDDPPAKASEAFKDPLRGDKLCELRSTGGQTMVCPSVWVDDENPDHTEAVVWERCGDPAPLASCELRAALGKVAAAALLARYWPTGCRHDLAGALAGGLLRAGWAAEAVTEFLEAIADAAGDEQQEDRSRYATDTAEKLRAGEHVTGWP